MHFSTLLLSALSLGCVIAQSDTKSSKDKGIEGSQSSQNGTGSTVAQGVPGAPGTTGTPSAPGAPEAAPGGAGSSGKAGATPGAPEAAPGGAGSSGKAGTPGEPEAAPGKSGGSGGSGAPGAPGAPGVPGAPGAPGAPGDQVRVHVVKVGSNGALTYEPNQVTAKAGEMVQFQFLSGNHTVSQSSFDSPCVPMPMMDAKNPSFYSGFMPISASSNNLPTYTVMINNTKPIWIYCAQGQHCQKGMSMVINEDLKANASRSISNYASLAAKVQNKGAEKGPSPSGNTPTNLNSGSSSPTGVVPKPGSGTASGNKDGSKSGSGSTGSDGAKTPGTGQSPPEANNPITSSAGRMANLTITVLFAALGLCYIL